MFSAAGHPSQTKGSKWAASSPNSEWTIGAEISDLHSETATSWSKSMKTASFKVMDPANTGPGPLYKMLTSGVVPRPIAFVSSMSSKGVRNLAPFSYFQLISHNPPILMVSVNAKSKEEGKDTSKNILETKEFVVNIISDAFVEGANFTSVDAPAEVDEWIASGLHPIESSTIKPPRVAESAFSMECTLYKCIEIPSGSDPSVISTYLILGQIKLIHVRTDVLTEKGDAVDPFKLQPVQRLGGPEYGRFTDGYVITRPKWVDVEDDVKRLMKAKGETARDSDSRL